MPSNSTPFDEGKQKMAEKNKSIPSSSISKFAPFSSSAAAEIPPEIAALSQLSISDSPKEPSLVVAANWTVWRYECRDLPEHRCQAKPCQFCEQVSKLKGVAKGKLSESTDRWDSYLKREKSYDDEHILIKVMEGFSPSKLAKDVFFNKKLGVALFRGDIEPKSESAENANGIVFQLLLLATSGRRSAALVSKFDTIFSQTLRLTLDLPSSVGRHVNGIFLRCEMNPGKNLEKEANAYGNLMDLPFMAKIEVWIRDRADKALVWEKLITKIQAKVDELALPSTACRNFFPMNRLENWAKKKGKFVGTAQFGIKKPFRKNHIVEHRNEN
ncbi:hypothetical protein niasHS_005757 [Heterodera schachtii]|uniref:Uncharacterized protein n=2 Tax=Heterodera TaxID=34509 RepID=A0ABD2JZI9_HETSC